MKAYYTPTYGALKPQRYNAFGNGLNAGRCWMGLLVVFLLACCGAAGAGAQMAEPATVRVAVLSLFHPRTLVLTTSQPIQQGGLSGVITVRATADGLSLSSGQTTVSAHALSLPATRFTLAVPGKLTRTYTGALSVTCDGGALVPVVTMDTELAVASIVAAESPANAPLEFLKSQAVTSRSYLLANLHPQAAADTCDTTRCQYLRSPPDPESAAARATRETRHQVLAWRPTAGVEPRVVPAMYGRSCGGQTHAHPTGDPGVYPFYAVRCDYCLRHPETWTRSAPATANETDRLAYNRVHGWSAIPSGTFTQAADGTLEGRGDGHGVGLCQLGAADLARRGQPYRAILAHFFPNTLLIALP